MNKETWHHALKDKQIKKKLDKKWFKSHYIWSKIIFMKQECSQGPLEIWFYDCA